MMNARLSVLACVVALGVAGCGGAGGSSSLPAAPHITAQMANAHVVITVPAGAKTATSSRRPAYVSPFTASITVQVDSGAPTTENLSPSSPNCTSSGGNYPLNCTVPVSATAGSHTVTFVTYDQQNAAGNMLSANSISVTFVTGQNPAIPVVLDGAPAGIEILPAAGATTITAHSTFGGAAPEIEFLWGTPSNVIITMVDADGNYIVGPGAAALNVSITGATTGSGIAVSPASNGNPNQFTLQSTGSGLATLSATATPGSALAGAGVSSSIALRSTAMTTTLINTATPTVPFSYPSGIAYDSADGNLYVMNSAYCQLGQVVPAAGGAVTSIAGQACTGVNPVWGFADGTGSAAQFGSDGYGSVVAYDSGNGDFYVSDTVNCAIRQMTAAYVVTTIAGGTPPTPSCGGYADGTGPAAQFTLPTGIAYDSKDGNLYVMDDCAIRQVTPAGVVTTIAGSPPPTKACGYVNGTGASARFGITGSWCTCGDALGGGAGIVYDPAVDALFVADYGNCAIREVTTAGVVTTIAGGGPGAGCGLTDGTGTGAKLRYPSGIAYDSNDGNLYVVEPHNCAVRQVTTAGVVFTIAGGATRMVCGGLTDGVGSFATVGNTMGGIAYDPTTGNLYIDDYDQGALGNAIREIQL